MKTFTFRLEAVLTMREREENQAKEEFARALRYRAEVQCELRAAQAELDAALAAISTLRHQPSNGTEHLLLIRAWRWTSEAVTRVQLALSAADETTEQRRKEFVGARQRHEALLKLKERQKLEYALAVRRAQEAEIADFVNARYGRTNSGMAA